MHCSLRHLYPWGACSSLPLVVCRFLLFLHFLGLGFLVCLCFAPRLLLCRFRSGGTATCLLQGIDLSGHGHNLFLIFRGLAPGIFLVEKSGFIFIFSPYHEVLRNEHHLSIITLTLEVLDVDYKLIIWSCFVGFLEIVE